MGQLNQNCTDDCNFAVRLYSLCISQGEQSFLGEDLKFF